MSAAVHVFHPRLSSVDGVHHGCDKAACMYQACLSILHLVDQVHMWVSETCCYSALCATAASLGRVPATFMSHVLCGRPIDANIEPESSPCTATACICALVSSTVIEDRISGSIIAPETDIMSVKQGQATLLQKCAAVFAFTLYLMSPICWAATVYTAFRSWWYAVPILT